MQKNEIADLHAHAELNWFRSHLSLLLSHLLFFPTASTRTTVLLDRFSTAGRLTHHSMLTMQSFRTLVLLVICSFANGVPMPVPSGRGSQYNDFRAAQQVSFRDEQETGQLSAHGSSQSRLRASAQEFNPSWIANMPPWLRDPSHHHRQEPPSWPPFAYPAGSAHGSTHHQGQLQSSTSRTPLKEVEAKYEWSPQTRVPEDVARAWQSPEPGKRIPP